MSGLPVPCMFSGGHFIPLASHKRYVADTYGDGEVVTLSLVEERSPQSHRFYFSVVNKAFENLPEDLADRFRSANHLRKIALIRAGYRSEITINFDTVEDAQKAGTVLQAIDDFAIVSVYGTSVTRWEAETQETRVMGRERFEASKNAVFNVLAEMIGVDPTTLLSEAERTT